MTVIAPSAPIVVGVDGSQAAIDAALWAIDEAVDRDVPLRLVHVLDVETDCPAPNEAFRLEVQYAESSLRAAAAAVRNTEKAVKIENRILWGPVGTALVKESQDAAMICVGSVGIDPIALEVLGSTAITLAENSHCPVAVIRAPHAKAHHGVDWIVAAVDERSDNDSVIEQAMNEARIRRAPVLAVGVSADESGETPNDELNRSLDKCKHQYPDVHVYPVSTTASLAGFLADSNDESVQLAIVGRAGADEVAQIIGPHSHAMLRHVKCSVLVVR